MKKLIRIIFLLLLVHYIFGECTIDGETGGCSGSPGTEKICVQDPSNIGNCMEDYSCTLKKGDENTVLDEAACKDLPVYIDGTKSDDYTCVVNTGTNVCVEKLLCGSAVKTGNEEIDCKTYPVTDSENYECVQNSEGDPPCKEEKKQNNAETTIVKLTQTLSEIATTIPKAIETTSLTKNQTLSEIVSTIISTTIAKEIETTSIPSSTNTDTETSIVFLGCSKFNMAPSYFTFSIHFIPLLNSLFSDTLTFILNIIHNTYLRRLENANAVCNKGESNSQMVNYDCRVEADTANIKQIKFEPEFTFSQGKVKIAGTSPLAKMSMNNLEKMDDKYSSLLSSNPSIYILDNSSFYRYDNYKFNISGTISGEEKPSSISLNKDLSLMMNIENSENEEEITKEANCTVTNINNDKYTLDCTAKDKNTYNLQSAMSIIDDKDILLVNINSSGNSDDGTVLDPYTEDDVQNVKYHSKKSGGIGAGAIVGIVLACVAALAAVITAILCLKKSPKEEVNNNSDIVHIKNINMN